MKLDQWLAALPVLTRLARIRGGKPIVHLDRATCLIEMDRFDEAREALADRPSLAGCPARFTLLAWVAAEQGDAEEAATLLRQASAARAVEERLAAAFAIAASSGATPTAIANSGHSRAGALN